MYVSYTTVGLTERNPLYSTEKDFGNLTNYMGSKWGDGPSTSFWLIPTWENFEAACK